MNSSSFCQFLRSTDLSTIFGKSAPTLKAKRDMLPPTVQLLRSPRLLGWRKSDFARRYGLPVPDEIYRPGVSYFSTQQLADLFGISKTGVLQSVKDERIESIRIGTTAEFFYSRAMIEELVGDDLRVWPSNLVLDLRTTILSSPVAEADADDFTVDIHERDLRPLVGGMSIDSLRDLIRSEFTLAFKQAFE